MVYLSCSIHQHTYTFRKESVKLDHLNSYKYLEAYLIETESGQIIGGLLLETAIN